MGQFGSSVVNTAKEKSCTPVPLWYSTLIGNEPGVVIWT